jgi:LacI family transcriptional regulator
MALGVMEALHERALEIPKDVAIVGYGDTPSAALLHRGGTTGARDRRHGSAASARAVAESGSGAAIHPI